MCITLVCLAERNRHSLPYVNSGIAYKAAEAIRRICTTTLQYPEAREVLQELADQSAQVLQVTVMLGESMRSLYDPHLVLKSLQCLREAVVMIHREIGFKQLELARQRRKEFPHVICDCHSD